MLKKRAGFDLVQIGLAAVAIAVLCTVAIMSVGSYVDSARKSEAKAACAQIAGAVSRYHYDMDAYPPDLTPSLTTAATGVGGTAVGPWLTNLPNDPWRNPYIYQLLPAGSIGFMVYSAGPDGANDSAGLGVFVGDDVGCIGQ